MLGYNIDSALLLLQDPISTVTPAVLVDFSLCVEDECLWIREKRGIITVVGHVEHCSVRWPLLYTSLYRNLL